MTDRWTDRLSEYIDDELAAQDRATLERHLASCVECGRTLEGLRRVVSRTSELNERSPGTDLWPGIARRITVAAQQRRRMTFSVPQLLAASIALAICSGGLVWLSAHRANHPAATSAGVPGASAVAAGWTSDPRYDAAIAELRAALNDGRASGRLDSTTVRVVERNLTVIDTAIAQARRALVADPGSAYLSHHLADTMRRKLDLLRQATVIATGRT